MTKSIQIQEAFKLALSMVLMYWLALWMDWDMPKYGGLAIVLVSLGTTGASLQKGLMRIVGTTFGLAMGLLVLAWFSQDRWATMVFLAVYLVAVGYFMQGSRYSYAWFVAGFLPPLVWSSTYMHVDNAFHYAIFRYLETTAGIIIYTLVSTLLWPRYAGTQVNLQGKDLWAGFRELFGLYRSQMVDGKPPGKAPELRAQLAGALIQMLRTLDAAYVDTPSVREQKKVWEVLRVNVRVLADAMELWRESMQDCRHLDLTGLLPWLDPGLDILDKRFERISELNQARQSSGEGSDAHDDAGLLQPALDVGDPGADLGHADRAALMVFVQQSQILDSATREVLRCMRVLAGLASGSGLHDQGLLKDLFKTSHWLPEHLAKALFPALCFVAGYVFWIYTDPPSGPSIPMIAATVSLVLLLTPANPITLLVVLVLSIWITVAPVYFFIMPALDTGFGLLSLIFIYTFVFGYLGNRSPVLKMGPLVMFVMMTGISNQQSYSFMGLVTGAMMIILGLCIIAVVQMLMSPIRPEKTLLRSLRRFFHGCAGVMGGFALYRPGDRTRGHKSRKRYFESMVMPVPGQLQSVSAHLDYKRFPDNGPEKVKHLVDRLQSITYRLQALEIAYDRVSARFPELAGTLGPQIIDSLGSLQQDFQTMARLKHTNAMEDGRAALYRLSLKLEKQLDARGETGEPSQEEEETFRDFYALLGGLRGLVEAMGETQGTLREINWDQWAQARF